MLCHFSLTAVIRTVYTLSRLSPVCDLSLLLIATLKTLPSFSALKNKTDSLKYVALFLWPYSNTKDSLQSVCFVIEAV